MLLQTRHTDKQTLLYVHYPQGELNDAMYARLFVSSKWRQTKKGPSLLRQVRSAMFFWHLTFTFQYHLTAHHTPVSLTSVWACTLKCV